MKLNTTEIQKTCLHCHLTFQAKRNTARYCSSSCRARAWQERNEPNDLPKRKAKVIQLSFIQELELQRHVRAIQHPTDVDSQVDLENMTRMVEYGEVSFKAAMEELYFRIAYNISHYDYRKTLLKKLQNATEYRPVTVDDVAQYLGFRPQVRTSAPKDLVQFFINRDHSLITPKQAPCQRATSNNSSIK